MTPTHTHTRLDKSLSPSNGSLGKALSSVANFPHNSCNPIAKPLLLGWTRLLSSNRHQYNYTDARIEAMSLEEAINFRIDHHILYLAPCGKRCSNHEDVRKSVIRF